MDVLQMHANVYRFLDSILGFELFFYIWVLWHS
ncbi:MAG: hypothetical protein ACI9A1_000655 [Lentimonas sp.]|jgi:hypothetical protein